MSCRLCLQKYKKLSCNIISSTRKYADLSLIESLYWIFGVDVDVNDPYSKYICKKCEKVVQYVGNYRTYFQRNQKILKGKFRNGFKQPIKFPIETPKPNKAKHDFIKYYYNIPTSAIQDLIRDKNNDRTLEVSDEELENEANDEVCKKCSQICTDTTHDCQYNKIQRLRTRKTKFKSKKHINQTYPNKFKRNGVNKKTLFDARQFPNLKFAKQLEFYDRKKKYKHQNLNLKDFYIPIVRCDEKTDEGTKQIENSQPVTVKEEINEFSSENVIGSVEIKRDLVSDNEESVNNWTDCDGTILAECKTVETVNQNESYDIFNLKNLTVNIERCPVPNGFYEESVKDENEAAKNKNSRNLQIVIAKMSIPERVQSVIVKSEFPEDFRSVPDMPRLENQEETNLTPVVSFAEKPPELEPQILNAPISLAKKKAGKKPYSVKRKKRQNFVIAQIENLANSLTSVKISNNFKDGSEVGRVGVGSETNSTETVPVNWNAVTYTEYLRRSRKSATKDMRSAIKSRWLNLTKNNTDILSRISKSQTIPVNSRN